MRKYITIICIIIACALVGCSNSEQPTENSNKKKSSTSKHYSEPSIGVIYSDGTRSSDIEDSGYYGESSGQENTGSMPALADASVNVDVSQNAEDKPQESQEQSASQEQAASQENASEVSTSSSEASGAGTDLFGYLTKKESDINTVLGEPKSNTDMSVRFYNGFDGDVQLFNDDVYMITLTGAGMYSILGFRPGDSTDELVSTLESSYGAKSRAPYGSQKSMYYFYVNGDVRFVDFTDSNGRIEELSCYYDNIGIFQEPTDVSGANSFTFTEDIY